MKKLSNENIHGKYGKKLLGLSVALLITGLFIVYNATAYYAQFLFKDPLRYVYLQLAWMILGAILMMFFANFDYHKLKTISFILFLASIFFLIILGFVGVFICKDVTDTGGIFTPCINGASRWIYLNPAPLPEIPFVGVLGFQPSELAKLAIILYLSIQLDSISKKSRIESDPFIVYIFSTITISFLLLLQPNMSTAMLILAIGSVVYFVSGNTLKPMMLAFPAFIMFGFIAILSSAYRRARFLTLVGLSSVEPLEAGYHIKQVLIALGSGGWFGLGFGQSRQKYQYLPEVASDSIFAIIGEEFGFIGTLAILFAFGYLLYIGFSIAKNTNDTLGKMLAVGITSWIGFQLFINVAAMTKLIPLTGMPIPLISHGGSSMIFTLASIGILLNIDKMST